jgi:putative membrane protein
MENNKGNNRGFGIGNMITRILVSAVVLAVVALLTPGFIINSIWTLLIAAVVIGSIDYLIERIAGFDASPFGRGITGFVVSVAIIYLIRYIIPGYNVGIVSAIIAALIIGVINAIMPGSAVL